jgi:hypothetical protein
MITDDTLTLVVNGSAWEVQGGSAALQYNNRVRTRLQGNTTFYIADSGSDTTGQGTYTAPWATMTHAGSVVNNYIDAAGYNVTFNHNGFTLISGTNVSGALWYAFSTAAPPSQDILLNVGDKMTIGFSAVNAIPLKIAAVQGVYKATLIVHTTNTTNSDWWWEPNNATYTNAFSSWTIETQDTGTASPPYISAAADVFTNASNQKAFAFDLFGGPTTGDTINDVGPCIQEFIVSTYTTAKMIKQSSGIHGGPASGFSKWADTATVWSSLGTLYDIGGNAAETVNATVAGTIIVERLA